MLAHLKRATLKFRFWMLFSFWKIFYDSLAWHWNRDLNIYFQFQKKSKSHNFTEIKYLHSCQNETLSKYHRNQNLKFSQKYTKPRIQRRFYHQSWVLKVLKHYKIFFCKFLGNYKRKIVFPPERGRGNLAKIKIFGRAQASIISI